MNDFNRITSQEKYQQEEASQNQRCNNLNVCRCRLASVQVQVESLSVQVQSSESQREGERYWNQKKQRLSVFPVGGVAAS